MLADDEHAVRKPGQHLRAEIPEASVAQYDDAILASDGQLRGNLEGGGDRLGEDGHIGRQRVGHGVEIALRHGDEVRERAVVVQDAEDRAMRAVAGTACAAGVALVAAAVDLADDAAAGQRTGLSHADELVAEHALESHVAAHELQVRLADAGGEDLDQHLAVPSLRLGVVAACHDAVPI